MSAQARILAEEFEFAFARFEKTLEGVDEKEYNYRLTGQSNSISMILNHVSRITNINMMRVISGDFSYVPEGWPSDYVEKSYSLKKLMKDIQTGKRRVIEGVRSLSDEQLEEVIPMMSGPYKRKIGLFAYVGEVFHHMGQIAFIRGTIKRLREEDLAFLKP
jgi:uncharacterized damage-inducible protein DinB